MDLRHACRVPIRCSARLGASLCSKGDGLWSHLIDTPQSSVLIWHSATLVHFSSWVESHTGMWLQCIPYAWGLLWSFCGISLKSDGDMILLFELLSKPMPDIKTIEVSTVNIRNITARSVCFSLYSNPPFYFSNSEKYAAFITGWLQFSLPWE